MIATFWNIRLRGERRNIKIVQGQKILNVVLWSRVLMTLYHIVVSSVLSVKPIFSSNSGVNRREVQEASDLLYWFSLFLRYLMGMCSSDKKQYVLANLNFKCLIVLHPIFAFLNIPLPSNSVNFKSYTNFECFSYHRLDNKTTLINSVIFYNFTVS